MTIVFLLLATPEGQWNAGGGIGFTTSTIGLGGNIGIAPTVNGSFERRLTPTMWLTFGARGSYERIAPRTIPSIVAGGTSATLQGHEGGQAAGTVGLRWVLNPEGVVEVSPTVRIAAGGGVVSTPYRATYVTAEALAGLVLERQLVDGLALRLSIDLLSAAWQRNFAASSPEDDLRVGLAFNPSLEARYYF